MKKSLVLFMVVGFVFSGLKSSTADIKVPQPYRGGNAFNRIKELAGTWEGVKFGESEEKAGAEVSVADDKKTVNETVSFGDSQVTFHFSNDNTVKISGFADEQPTLVLVADDDEKMQFALADKAPSGTHLHLVVISVTDRDHIIQRWEFYQGSDNPINSLKVMLTRTRKAGTTSKHHKI